jgi:nucleoside-diphosphate-sugar epimerase
MSVALEHTGRLPLLGARATRDFTFIDDCVKVLLRAERAAGQIVNVGTGRETQICALADGIRHLMGCSSAPIDIRAPRDWDRVERRCADVMRLRERFGFVPDTPLEAGLRQTLAWLHSKGFINRAPQ